MDIYQSTIHYLLTLPIFNFWAEMRAIFGRIAATHPRDWQLPLIACQAVGGPAEKAVPGSATLACAQISIILVDDILDDDPRGEYRRLGNGRASNLAIAFQAAAVQAILQSDASSSIRLDALETLNRMMLTTAQGQELDIQNPAEEASYWHVVENKSAPFYGCGLRLGAIFAEAEPEVTNSLEQLGRLYGEMIQIHDDLNDTMAVPANPDWLQKRKPLPVLFALSVEHPDRAQFVELYENISIGNALQEAQEILIRCGAISYCVDQLVRRYEAAQGLLNKTRLLQREGIDSLLEAVIAPVWKLFETLGVRYETLPRAAEGSDWG